MIIAPQKIGLKQRTSVKPQLMNMDREEKILDIQENFETIYQKSLNLFENQEIIRTPEYTHELTKTLIKAEDEYRKLREMNDAFSNDIKNTKIISSFKVAFKEIIQLLYIIKNIEGQKLELNKLSLQGPKQPFNMALIKEIKNSEKRLQRIKAGVKLPQVLQEQLALKMKQVKQIRIQTLQVPQGTTLTSPINMDKTAIGLLDSMQTSTHQQNKKCGFVQVAGKFIEQKKKVEGLMRECLQVEEENKFNFQNKYNNLVPYFQERFKLANIQMGDDQLNEFFIENQQACERQLMTKKIVIDGTSTDLVEPDKQYIKDLDPKNFVTQEDVEERAETVKKILRVNQEIKKELMLEDHQLTLEAINTFKVQQKQNHWDNDLPEESMCVIENKFINLRPQCIKQSKPNTAASLCRPSTKTSQKKSVLTSLNKKTLFYQAHPNFPLIKQVYQDTDKNLAIQEGRLKEALIPNDRQNKIRKTISDFNIKNSLISSEVSKDYFLRIFSREQQRDSREQVFSSQNRSHLRSTDDGLRQIHSSELNSSPLINFWGETWKNNF